MKTLLLQTDAWDLCIDASSNIAVASNPYSLAQDAASAGRTWRGECWYDTLRGVPYLPDLLGVTPVPIELIIAEEQAAAFTVPEVQGATFVIGSIQDRVLVGQMQIVGPDGTSAFAPVVTSGVLHPVVTDENGRVVVSSGGQGVVAQS